MTLKKLNKNSAKILEYLVLQGCKKEYTKVSVQGIANAVKMDISSVSKQLGKLTALGYISKMSEGNYQRTYKFYVIKDKIEE